MINGLHGKLFLIGGHDLESEESTSEVFEIFSEDSYKMEKRTNMLYKRVAHSACWFGDNNIVVTGSIRQQD